MIGAVTYVIQANFEALHDHMTQAQLRLGPNYISEHNNWTKLLERNKTSKTHKILLMWQEMSVLKIEKLVNCMICFWK